MDTRTRLNKLITTTLGMMTYFLEEITKPSGKDVEGDSGIYPQAPGQGAGEMIRVTDSKGDEYLCPIGALHNEHFVGEQDKKECFDYNLISEHHLE